MSYIDDLVAALRAEFGNDPKVMFSPSVPTNFSPPQIVVTPGDPFLEPGSMGHIRERWAVLVVVSMADRKVGLDSMRRSSLRIQRSANKARAIWEQASGPQLPSEDNRSIVLSENSIYFKYDPTEITEPTP